MSAVALAAAWSVPLGALLGAVYDVIRFFRVLLGIDVRTPFASRGRRCGKWVAYVLVALGDFLFWCIAAVCMCVFFFLTGDGRMRAHALFGAFIGFELYYHTVGRLFIGICARCASACKRAARWILRKSLLPLRLLAMAAQKMSARIFGLSIVRRTRLRYNEHRRKKKEDFVRRKRQRSGQYCKNG